MKRTLWIICSLLLPLAGFAQVKDIGVPKIRNYPKSLYKAGTQNWGIAQDPDGFMFFANNEGLLRFDGVNWDLFRVSNPSPVRSVCVDKNGSIYIGLDDDFGIYETHGTFGPRYTSLRDKLPEGIDATDVIWKIFDTQFGIVFQSFSYIFIYNKGEIRVIRPQREFNYSFYVNKRLFFHEPGVGLFEYINGFVNKVPWAGELKEMEIRSIIEFHENHLLIGTAHNGWFQYRRGKLEKWEVPANEATEKYILYCAAKIDDSHLAIGTILNGVVIANSDGKIVQHINREMGIQNNTVLSAFRDNSGNLWLGLDNGVDYIELNSPLSYISRFEGISTGYACLVYDNNLYLGTNQGLFVKPFSVFGSDVDSKFELIEGTEGQVWSLKVVNNQLVCGHNLGTFLIDGNRAQKISDEAGAWGYVQLSGQPDLMLGGHFSGLVLFRDDGNGWRFAGKIKGYFESTRFLTEGKNGSLWMSHGSKGIFRIDLNDAKDSLVNLVLYDSGSGLPANDHNISLEINKNWYVSTIDGLYEYDADSDRFEPSDELNHLFGLKQQLKFATVDEQENIWYIAGGSAGVLHKNDDFSYSRITAPFAQLNNTFVGGFEYMYVRGNDNVFFATQDGFAHYTSRIVLANDSPFKCFIKTVELPYLDSVVYRGDQSAHEFSFKKNAFRFSFSAPFFQNPELTSFSWFIDNYSENWSEWSADNYRDFTNLSEGEYTFRLKARNSFGAESNEASFSFVILPPWYRSKLAVYLYVVFLLLLILLGFWLIRRRFERSKHKERKKHQKEMRKQEEEYRQQALLADKEIIRLKNDRLEAEKIFLDKELANQTLNIVEKNKFLTKINQELSRIAGETDDGTARNKMNVLKKRIDREIDGREQKKIFESYFEEIHAEFFQRLKNQYPQLSPKDLRLCAYIRMNISTKEIATLLNISDRGVEISRYRLRKKMELAREVNLSAFLLGI